MIVCLIDGKNALFRFGFAQPNLCTRDRVPTGALYGILGLLPRLKKAYPAARFAMIWDGRGKSWRHTFWRGYKANRPEEKSEVVERILIQEPIVRQVCGLMGIPQLDIAAVEADDLIGILAVALRKKEHDAIVYSSDKDFLQLMHFGVIVIRNVQKERKMAPETEKTVEETFGCCLGDVLMVRAIAGDVSDGIPNPVRGIGAKRAAGYLQAGEWPEALIVNWSLVQRNYRLMKIATSLACRQLTAEQREAARECRRVVLDLGRSEGLEDRAYGEWIGLLGRYEMSDALENRGHLWGIQE